MNNYKIIEKGYKNNARKQKFAEAILIKKIKPTLNKQDNSVELKLVNCSFDIRRFNHEHLSIYLIVL